MSLVYAEWVIYSFLEMVVEVACLISGHDRAEARFDFWVIWRKAQEVDDSPSVSVAACSCLHRFLRRSRQPPKLLKFGKRLWRMLQHLHCLYCRCVRPFLSVFFSLGILVSMIQFRQLCNCPWMMEVTSHAPILFRERSRARHFPRGLIPCLKLHSLGLRLGFRCS